MNDQTAALVHDGIALLSAAFALGAVLMSRRNGQKIQEVHLSINSRMDQLLEQKGLASEAKGAAEARDSDQKIAAQVMLEGTKK